MFLYCINNSLFRIDYLGLKCRIIRLIGHFAGKSEQEKGEIWSYYKSANLDKCDIVFAISCHMDEFLSETEGVATPSTNLWPPRNFSTGTITASAFPYLLDQSEKLIENLKASGPTSPCCCESYTVETICDQAANEDIKKLMKNQDSIRFGPYIKKNPCQKVLSSPSRTL